MNNELILNLLLKIPAISDKYSKDVLLNKLIKQRNDAVIIIDFPDISLKQNEIDSFNNSLKSKKISGSIGITKPSNILVLTIEQLP